MYPATWKNVEYNHGNHFDGISFTAPAKGIYTFLATADQKSYHFGFLRFCLNDNKVVFTNRSNCSEIQLAKNMNRHCGPLLLQITLQLERNDKATIQVFGHLFNLADPKTTYFEGRLVSVIKE